MSVTFTNKTHTNCSSWHYWCHVVVCVLDLHFTLQGPRHRAHMIVPITIMSSSNLMYTLEYKVLVWIFYLTSRLLWSWYLANISCPFTVWILLSCSEIWIYTLYNIVPRTHSFSLRPSGKTVEVKSMTNQKIINSSSGIFSSQFGSF